MFKRIFNKAKEKIVDHWKQKKARILELKQESKYIRVKYRNEKRRVKVRRSNNYEIHPLKHWHQGTFSPCRPFATKWN